MKILTRPELEQIIHKEQQWCVSIYFPTHRTGVETQQDPIQPKNLLREAEKLLSARGLSKRDVQKMLEPASKLSTLLNQEKYPVEQIPPLCSGIDQGLSNC